MSWKLPWEGGCRCNKLRFRITHEPLLAAACHCAGCQRMTASAFSLSIAVPRAGFTVIAGEAVIGGLHDKKALHHMCKHCLSWVYTSPEGFDLINFRATMLDDHAWFQPYVDMNAAEKLPWATTGAPHSYDKQPSMAELGPLCASFAKEGMRP